MCETTHASATTINVVGARWLGRRLTSLRLRQPRLPSCGCKAINNWESPAIGCTALSPTLTLTLSLSLCFPCSCCQTVCVVKIKCKWATAKCAQMFFWGNTANKTEQRKQIERGGSARRRGEAAQHVLSGKGACLPLNFNFITKISIFVLSVFMALFSPKCGTMGNISWGAHTGNWLLFMITTTTRTNALHTWESVSFRFWNNWTDFQDITEQKPDRYNKCNICPIETLHSKEAGEWERNRLHNAYDMRCLGTLSLSSGLFNNWRHAYETGLGASQVFFLHKKYFSYFSMRNKKNQRMSLWNSILAGYFCTPWSCLPT